jgi:hypothetical protein
LKNSSIRRTDSTSEVLLGVKGMLTSIMHGEPVDNG